MPSSSSSSSSSSSLLYYCGLDTNLVGAVQVEAETRALVQETLYPVSSGSSSTVSSSTSNGTTDWIVKHPTQPLLIALISFGTKQSSSATIFSTSMTTNGLERLASTGTLGRQACHAVFYHSTESAVCTLAMAHHADARVSFLQLPADRIPDTLEPPTVSLEVPHITTNNNATNTTSKSIPPSSQCVCYAPHGKCLWVVDQGQSTIFTYPTDPTTGLPTSPQPSSSFACHTTTPVFGWFAKMVGSRMYGVAAGPRRMALSPNGQYLYVLYELRNELQVYQVDASTGQLDPTQRGCLQHVSTLDAALVHSKVVGLTVQASAELIVHDDYLYVSNRGDCMWGASLLGRVENSIRIFGIADGGRLVAHDAVPCAGPVKHMTVSTTKDGTTTTLVAATTKPGCALQTFVRTNGDSDNNNKFQAVGRLAHVGRNLTSVVEGS